MAQVYNYYSDVATQVSSNAILGANELAQLSMLLVHDCGSMPLLHIAATQLEAIHSCSQMDIPLQSVIALDSENNPIRISSQ